MDWRSVGLLSLCGALAIFTPKASLAHLAHPGYSGLISTPNAEVLPQGKLVMGFSWIDGLETYLFAPKTNRIYVVTVGLLPGLEATLRQTQVIGWYDPDAPGVQHAFDRMFSAKYTWTVPGGHPRIAIGVQDIMSANFITGARGVTPGVTQYGQPTLYGVIGDNHVNWAWHCGLGISQAFINGLFAGITYQPLEHVKLFSEWDSHHLNWGIQILPLQDWWIQLSSINQTTWGFSSGVRLAL